jgi:hypothetical protein
MLLQADFNQSQGLSDFFCNPQIIFLKQSHSSRFGKGVLEKATYAKGRTFKFPLKNRAGGYIFNFNKDFRIFFRLLYSRY